MLLSVRHQTQIGEKMMCITDIQVIYQAFQKKQQHISREAMQSVVTAY